MWLWLGSGSLWSWRHVNCCVLKCLLISICRTKSFNSQLANETHTHIWLKQWKLGFKFQTDEKQWRPSFLHECSYQTKWSTITFTRYLNYTWKWCQANDAVVDFRSKVQFIAGLLSSVRSFIMNRGICKKQLIGLRMQKTNVETVDNLIWLLFL